MPGGRKVQGITGLYGEKHYNNSTMEKFIEFLDTARMYLGFAEMLAESHIG